MFVGPRLGHKPARTYAHTFLAARRFCPRSTFVSDRHSSFPGLRGGARRLPFAPPTGRRETGRRQPDERRLACQRLLPLSPLRSEERRVGKEWRSRCWTNDERKREKNI